ncbi:MAG: hypothetical protein AAF741_15595 [Bacteroidota bacterium]
MLGIARQVSDTEPPATAQPLAEAVGALYDERRPLPAEVPKENRYFILDLARKKAKANLDAHHALARRGKCSKEAYLKGKTTWQGVMDDIDILLAEMA